MFAARPDFQAAVELLQRLAEVVERIVSRGVSFERGSVDALRQKLEAAEPYCAWCPSCHSISKRFTSPDCSACSGRGWTTRAAFAACGQNARELLLSSSFEGIGPA